MADLDVITAARSLLDDQISDLALLVRVLDSCNMDDPPDWLALFFGRLLDLEKSRDAYFFALREVSK